jgi:hypothetical protein
MVYGTFSYPRKGMVHPFRNRAVDQKLSSPESASPVTIVTRA